MKYLQVLHHVNKLRQECLRYIHAERWKYLRKTEPPHAMKIFQEFNILDSKMSLKELFKITNGHIIIACGDSVSHKNRKRKSLCILGPE